MKRITKILAIVCLVSMLFSIFSIAAAAKTNDDEEYRLVAIAGKLYKVLESNEVRGSVEQADYIAIKTKYITSALGGVVSDMDTPSIETSSTEVDSDTVPDVSTDNVVNSDTVSTEEENAVCENGVCYVDSVLDENPAENVEETVTATVFDDEEAIAFFEANTESDATSIGDTTYPYKIKTELDEAGVDSTIWTITTAEGNTIYLNVFELKSGKQLKAFSYAGKPREVTTLSDGDDLMAKRLLCKTCNAKRSFGVVETISK